MESLKIIESNVYPNFCGLLLCFAIALIAGLLIAYGTQDEKKHILAIIIGVIVGISSIIGTSHVVKYWHNPEATYTILTNGNPPPYEMLYDNGYIVDKVVMDHEIYKIRGPVIEE